MNLEAVDELAARFPDIELVLIESGGDNLSATFSPDLADVTIFIIDVAEGEKIPRKGVTWYYKIRFVNHQQNRSCSACRCKS